jgi:hypothetical protein
VARSYIGDDRGIEFHRSRFGLGEQRQSDSAVHIPKADQSGIVLLSAFSKPYRRAEGQFGGSVADENVGADSKLADEEAPVSGLDDGIGLDLRLVRAREDRLERGTEAEDDEAPVLVFLLRGYGGSGREENGSRQGRERRGGVQDGDVWILSVGKGQFAAISGIASVLGGPPPVTIALWRVAYRRT